MPHAPNPEEQLASAAKHRDLSYQAYIESLCVPVSPEYHGALLQLVSALTAEQLAVIAYHDWIQTMRQSAYAP